MRSKIARSRFAHLLATSFAWLLMGAAAILIRLAPSARFTRMLGRPLGAVSHIPVIDEEQLRRARFVRRTIARAVRIAPFRADCLPQAMTAAMLCRILRVPAATHFGVKLANEAEPAMAAHAWTVAGPIPICGGHAFDDYVVLACFLVYQAQRGGG